MGGLLMVEDAPLSSAPPMAAPVQAAGGLEDEDLVRRAHHGDEAAFEELYQRHGRLVRWMVRKMLRSPEDAEDCCQEIWLKVRDKLGSFEGRSKFRTWLTTLATNHARDALRARDRFRRVLGAALDVYRYERQLEAADDRPDTRPLLAAVAGLEDLQRQVIEARLEDGSATITGIAEKLGMPRHKVKYAWSTALEALKQRLTERGAVETYLTVLVLALLDTPAIVEGVRHVC